MAELAIPFTPDEITAAWLTEALAEATGGATVSSVVMEPLAADVGLLGVLHRIAIEYEGDVPDSAPRSVISKLPATEGSLRGFALMLRWYENENRFYEELAADTPVNTPRVYLSAADPQAQRFVLLLEDIDPARVGDQLAETSMQDAKLSMTELAKLHAAWWNNERLDELAWLPNLKDQAYAGLLAAVFQGGWPNFLSKQGNELPEFPPELVNLGALLATPAGFNAMLAKAQESPQTVAHCDYRPDNLLFEAGRDELPLVVIDWQLISISSGLRDVSYYIAGGFDPQRRREIEDDLVRTYHDSLLEQGVENYPFERCWADYRIASLTLFVQLVAGQDQENFQVESIEGRGASLLELMFERWGSAVIDHAAWELLDI